MTALNDLNALQASIAEAVLGQDEVIRQILVGLLANGHLLLESLPGLAKTRTVKALARHLDAKINAEAGFTERMDAHQQRLMQFYRASLHAYDGEREAWGRDIREVMRGDGANPYFRWFVRE